MHPYKITGNICWYSTVRRQPNKIIAQTSSRIREGIDYIL